MLCPGCGREIDEKKRFCMYCGAEVKPPGSPVAERPTGTAAGPVGSPPSGIAPPFEAPYQAPYAARRPIPQPPPAPRAAGRPGSGSIALGIIVLVSGVLMLISTFFSWFHGAGLFEDSGWEVMRSMSGNFLWKAGDGKIFFSGFWSLAFGALLIVAGVILMRQGKAGGALALACGLLAGGVACVNVVMLFTVFSDEFGSISPGVGLWAFAGTAVIALVIGIIGVSRSG